MLKIMLWPFVVAAIALVVIAIVARKGNGIASIAGRLKRHQSRTSVLIATALLIALGGAAAWMSIHADNPIDGLFALAFACGFGAVAIGVALISAAVNLFSAAAPVAAEIGEQLSNEEKRKVLRRTLRWYARFRKW